jgi:hypothetical protein
MKDGRRSPYIHGLTWFLDLFRRSPSPDSIFLFRLVDKRTTKRRATRKRQKDTRDRHDGSILRMPAPSYGNGTVKDLPWLNRTIQSCKLVSASADTDDVYDMETLLWERWDEFAAGCKTVTRPEQPSTTIQAQELPLASPRRMSVDRYKGGLACPLYGVEEMQLSGCEVQQAGLQSAFLRRL